MTSETEALDFYINDGTGKIKVDAYGITIYCPENQKSTQKGQTFLFEELLLSNQTKYTLVGSVVKNENNELNFEKDPLLDQLYIFDDYYVENALNIPLIQRFGCSLLLLVCFGVVIYFLFFN